jgi:hypothetical protein
MRCDKPAQAPVAVLHQHGSRHDRDLYVLWLADLQSLLDETICAKEMN